MESARFDLWTRRRFGLAAGGAVGLLTGLTSLGVADARNRPRKKKRCKRLRDTCTQGGKRKCCKRLTCDEVLGSPGFFCCKQPHTPCVDQAECCGSRVCDIVFGATGTFCCGRSTDTLVALCDIDQDCCTGFGCFEGFCKLA